MNDKILFVFNGFLNLNGKEKLQLVASINEYFDSDDKERIRAEHDRAYDAIDLSKPGIGCKCCGRSYDIHAK